METQRRVVCIENEELASFMLKKRQEIADDSKGISERIDMTLSKAYSNVCNAKSPIKTLKDFSQIKGVGKWILRLMQEFFMTESCDSEENELPARGKEKGKRGKGTKRYVPQKNSVAYALLITLYRGTMHGEEYMRKQELIDAAEASGLSRAPIAAELGKGKPGQFGSSPKEWYSGWSCMKTLITKGLVAKSSCPAKYMLTQEGQEAAHECLSRSGLVDHDDQLAKIQRLPNETVQMTSDLQLDKEDDVQYVDLSNQKEKIDVPVAFLETFKHMGYTEEQIHGAFAKVSCVNLNKDTSSLWSATLHHLRKDQVDTLLSECRQTLTASSGNFKNVVELNDVVEDNNRTTFAVGRADHVPDSSCSVDSAKRSFTLQACSSNDFLMHRSPNSVNLKASKNCLMIPPLASGEIFGDVYDVTLILDDREQFTHDKGSRSRKIIQNICSEFRIKIEVRRLPVGDGIWIAQHKHFDREYVLDFIVERKKVDDLRSSIRDNRYRDQKLRLLRCGLRKIIYLVEGDPNFSEAAESIKTACFTTEILEGFEVQRTSGLGDTLKRYGYLTLAIANRYRECSLDDKINDSGICPSYDDFVRKCQDLEKMTVSDVFAVQLMQVPQVTEDIALAVLDLYPTLISLARAYSHLEGDEQAQEEMLKKQSNNFISAVASRNIYHLAWGG